MFSRHIGRYDFASYGSLSPPLYMRDNSAFLCCVGKYPFLKQSFIIWVRNGAVISEVFWYILALIPSGPGDLFGFSVWMYSLISLTSTTSSSSVDSLSPSNASSSFKNRHFIISFAISCQPAVMDPSAFLMDMMFPVFSLFATIPYVMDHGSVFMLSSTYFFQVFSLAVHIAVLYFWRQLS